MTLPLTEKQERLWRYIKSCDRSPSHAEMTTALGGKTKGAMTHAVILALETKGYIRRTPYLARSVIALDPTTDLEKFSTSTLAAEVARRLAA